MNTCPICKTQTKNKKYCSRECQYKGYSDPNRINNCKVCGKETKNKVHCSRKCYAITDSQTKQEYFKENEHHTKGRKHTEEYINQKRIETALSWKDPKIREARINSAKQTAIENGYANGWSPEGIEKRNKTIEENGGHNFSGKYGTRQCDKTFMERYGMTSVEYRQYCLLTTTKTSIELKVEDILKKYNIRYIEQFLYKGKHFDFLLVDFNIILECDGDWHHGKDVLLEDMTPTQLATYNNDNEKNKLIKNSKYTLHRYWGSDIEKNDFETKIKELWVKK